MKQFSISNGYLSSISNSSPKNYICELQITENNLHSRQITFFSRFVAILNSKWTTYHKNKIWIHVWSVGSRTHGDQHYLNDAKITTKKMFVQGQNRWRLEITSHFINSLFPSFISYKKFKKIKYNCNGLVRKKEPAIFTRRLILQITSQYAWAKFALMYYILTHHHCMQLKSILLNMSHVLNDQ